MLRALAVAGVAAGAIYYIATRDKVRGEVLYPGQTRIATNSMRELETGFPTIRTLHVPGESTIDHPESSWGALAAGAAFTLVFERWRVDHPLAQSIGYVIRTTTTHVALPTFGRPAFMPPWVQWRDTFETSRIFYYMSFDVLVNPDTFPQATTIENREFGTIPYMFWIDHLNGFAVVDMWLGDYFGYWVIKRTEVADWIYVSTA